MVEACSQFLCSVQVPLSNTGCMMALHARVSKLGKGVGHGRPLMSFLTTPGI